MSDYIAVECPTCKQGFIILSTQVIEHQTERAHSGRMQVVHVIKEREE